MEEIINTPELSEEEQAEALSEQVRIRREKLEKVGMYCLVLRVQAFKRRKNPVTIARRNHLFPCRTQKLSSLTSMVLGG